MRRTALCASALFLSLTSLPAEVQISVFNNDLALVRERRDVSLEKGVSRTAFTDVAARIDPSSVHLTFPDISGSCSVLEQNFEYDLVSREKLLEKYIGQEIVLERPAGRDGEKKERINGTLLSTSGGIIVGSGDRILLDPSGEISLASLPDGLVLKPTLSWLLKSDVSGKREAELAYLTNGIGWNADYVAVLGRDDKGLTLTGWVTVNNQSGASYRDARVKLVAGDVNRAAPAGARMAKGMMMDAAMPAAAPQFEERSFFEYHQYTLQRPATIRDNEIKQIEFTGAVGVKAEKGYVYDGAAQFRQGSYDYQSWTRADRNYGTASDRKVSVTVSFKNGRENNLGIPLPAGRVRMYKEDTDGALEFIGEDAIDHTPKDEAIRASLGNAFDIVGERTQTDFRSGSDWCEESFSITLRNHKDTPVPVTVVEHLYRWSSWKITARSSDFRKRDSRTVEFPVNVPANGSATVTYTARYWW